VDRGAEFQVYVRGCLDSLHNYAVLVVRPPEDYEDVLQEALIRGFQGFDTFDRTLPFRAWMLAIIRNTCIDRHRRRRLQPLEESLDDERGEPVDSGLYAIPLAPEDVLVRRETIAQVREGIRRLPLLLREVVELRDIEGFSYRTIATIIGRPVGTVMSRLYRGRNLLRTYLVEPGRPGGHPSGISHEM
jgi:RNA polymerase sigma-70 factor (ECF subfamily)